MGNGLGIIDEYALNIFTDGSSFPQKKRAAGIGVRLVWVNDDGNEETSDFSPPGWEKATIDEMEIKACTMGLQEAMLTFPDLSQFKKIIIFTDSSYVKNNFIRAMNIWPKTKWRLSNGMPASNITLWKELKREVGKCLLHVEVQWVKAHTKNPHNRAADKLAKQSASIPINKPISISETTKKWSDRKTKRGCIPMLSQEVCIRIISTKYITKAKTYEYRYEIINPSDKNFKDIDFIFCNEYLSRNHCYKVSFNDNQKKQYIIDVLDELNSEDYKY